jgi:2'-5' RNA ligase
MRLFMAVELDDDARLAVAAEQARVRRRVDDAGARWVRPELMHLTLVFIGQVDDTRVPAFHAAMSTPVQLPPFRIQLGGVGVFPERGGPRVLWLGVRDGAAQAVALQRLVAERLEPLGVRRETRPFHPHVTLARWKEQASRSIRDRVVHPEAPAVATVNVGRITLLASTLSARGPSYTAMTHALLSCP